MLYILIKAMPICNLTTIKIHILVTKMAKTLDFDDFCYFDMTSVMTSQSRHTWGCWYLFGING